MANSELQACEFMLIRVAADPIRNEPVNIGVALYQPQAGGFAGVRINPDFQRVRQLSPLFEDSDLQGLEADLLERLRTAAPVWNSREYLLQLAQESFSQALQITAPAVVLTADPAWELEWLYRQYAAPPPTARREAEASARRRIVQHLLTVFREERVLGRLERNARPGDWLGEPDAFRFDFHYQPNGLHHVMQAIPLEGGEGAVKELCFTVHRLRARLGGLDVAGFAEAAPPESSPEYGYHRSLLTDAGVRMMTLGEAPAEAARIRAALGIA